MIHIWLFLGLENTKELSLALPPSSEKVHSSQSYGIFYIYFLYILQAGISISSCKETLCI